MPQTIGNTSRIVNIHMNLTRTLVYRADQAFEVVTMHINTVTRFAIYTTANLHHILYAMGFVSIYIRQGHTTRVGCAIDNRFLPVRIYRLGTLYNMERKFLRASYVSRRIEKPQQFVKLSVKEINPCRELLCEDVMSAIGDFSAV